MNDKPNYATYLRSRSEHRERLRARSLSGVQARANARLAAALEAGEQLRRDTWVGDLVVSGPLFGCAGGMEIISIYADDAGDGRSKLFIKDNANSCCRRTVSRAAIMRILHAAMSTGIRP